MITEKFLEVLKEEGVVSIVSIGEEEPHLVNTWNSYLVLTPDEKDPDTCICYAKNGKKHQSKC